MCPVGFVPKSPGSPKFPSFCSAASASWLGVGFGMSSVLYRLRNGPPRKRQHWEGLVRALIDNDSERNCSCNAGNFKSMAIEEGSAA